MRSSFHRAVAVAALVWPALLSAQGAAKRGGRGEPRAATACAISSTAPWVIKQAEWFNESGGKWSNEAMRAALLSAARLAPPLGEPVQNGVVIEGKLPVLGPTADSVKRALESLAAERGSAWPTKSVVGAAGTHAVYLLALGDTGFARVALKRMMEAGPDESPAADVATLEDRLRLETGRKQLYGTQFRREPNGSVLLAPMEDSAHADLRREDAGLPPFKLGICLAQHPR